MSITLFKLLIPLQKLSFSFFIFNFSFFVGIMAQLPRGFCASIREISGASGAMLSGLEHHTARRSRTNFTIFLQYRTITLKHKVLLTHPSFHPSFLLLCTILFICLFIFKLLFVLVLGDLIPLV